MLSRQKLLTQEVDVYSAVSVKLEEIEAELRRMGLWQKEPLAVEKYKFRKAFAMDTMIFPQWLQFVLIPRMRKTVEETGELPEKSTFGVQAMREFDSLGDSEDLVSLLFQLDALLEGEEERSLHNRSRGRKKVRTDAFS